MAGLDTLSPDTCRVLEEDPDLAEAISPARREQAVRECQASVRTMPVASGSGPPPEGMREGIGLLVLEGLLIRRVGIDGRFGAELLGQGDLLRPWHGEDEPPTLPITTGWRVLSQVRVAILDNAFSARLARYPELAGRLVGRAVGRSRHLAVNMAIVHQARVDVRLHMLFWHLAARWGRVGVGRVSLPLPLTHALLAEIAAARRPTVSSALSELSRRGLARAVDGGWELYGEPPGELLELTPVGSRV